MAEVFKDGTGGILAVSELTYLTASRPDELTELLVQSICRSGDGSRRKSKHLEEAGYVVVGYFPLPKHCWMQNYYLPLKQSFDSFLERHSDDSSDAAAKAVVESQREEIALYEKYSDYISYGFYIARKI